jgi:hypothetical protein
MGQTADQLRDEVDQAREAATQKIEDIEEKVTNAAEQVKEQFDWRRQVDNHPLTAVGAALVGGMVLGGLTGGGDHHDGHDHGYSSSQSSGARYQSVQHNESHSGISGMTDAIRSAAKSSGFDDAIHHVADAALGTLGERIRHYADEMLSGSSSKREMNGTRATYPTTAARTTPATDATANMGADYSAQ